MTGPLPDWLNPVATAASAGYGAAVRWRNRRLDDALAVSCGVPVISVGNIVAGGTGKTPMTQWIVRTLQGEGHAPMIAMRGHRGGENSDEVREHRRALPGVPLAVGADRTASVAAARAGRPECDVVVLDDGFQHRRLRRDADWVLVDATRPALHDALLPRGWLREPASSLRRATGVIVTRADAVDAALDAEIRALHGQPPLAWCRHAWVGLDGEGDVEARGLAWLQRTRVAVWAGTGHPQSIIAMAAAHGAVVVHAPRLADHARWDAAMVARLVRRAQAAGADAVLVTPKDWTKIEDLPKPAAALPMVRPRLAIEFLQGQETLHRELLRAVRVGRIRCAS
jgi:tetraacyldisaccharide 4'-kinase